MGDGERIGVVALWIVNVRACSDRVTGDIDKSVPIVASEPKERKTRRGACAWVISES